MINIVLADDHKIMIEGLRSFISHNEDIMVLGTAGNGEELLKLMEKSAKVDVAVLDIEMEKLNGVETTKILQREYPGTKVLILSMHKEKQLIMELMKLGISGYLLKDNSPSQLVHAIHQVHSGHAHFGLNVLNELAKPDEEKEPEPVPLTEREQEVLTLIGMGCTTKEISDKLGILETTVNTHKRNLRHKLDAPNEKHLVRYAIKHGYAEV